MTRIVVWVLRLTRYFEIVWLDAPNVRRLLAHQYIHQIVEAVFELGHRRLRTFFTPQVLHVEHALRRENNDYLSSVAFLWFIRLAGCTFAMEFVVWDMTSRKSRNRRSLFFSRNPRTLYVTSPA